MSETPAKPLHNSYWVRPGQLLAGEYPLVKDDEQSAVRLQDMLLAGVNCFINLTAEGELTAYQPRLPVRFGGKPVVHHRFAIADHGVPESTQQMTMILNALDQALASGNCVYVHCRAGIGRTGTVIGCHLVRHGYTGDEAIEALNALWQSCGRAASWPHVPETDAQTEFVRRFSEDIVAKPVIAGEHGRLGAYQGALLGLALGDAMGDALGDAMSDAMSASRATQGDMSDAQITQVFNNLSDMNWGSDTAMSLALADSLLSCKQMQPEHQMQCYLAWQKQGRYSSDDQPGKLPAALHKALGLWQWKRNPLAGSHDPALIDAHPLARCAPVALYFAQQPAVAINAAAESARTSSQAPIVLDACRVFAAILLAIMEGVPMAKWVELQHGSALTELRKLPLKPELLNLINGGWRTAMTDPAGEDVVSVLASAIHALATTHSFQAAIFKSMQSAQLPSTVAAVCGALAGALYGAQGLPIVWRETLPKASQVLVVSERLFMNAAAPKSDRLLVE